MDANEYQKNCMRTANGGSLDRDRRFSNWALGLAGEAGEVADEIKKIVHHEKPLSPEFIAKELGDILWYVAVLAKDISYDLSEIMELNLRKLQKRYPKGFKSYADREKPE